MGRNSGHTIRHFWTKFYQTKCGCVGAWLQFATPFSDWWYLIAFQRYSWSSHEAVWNCVEILMLLGCFLAAKFFLWRGAPNFLTHIYKYWSSSNLWQSLAMIGQAISEIRQQKIKIRITINIRSKTEWPVGQHSCRGAIKMSKTITFNFSTHDKHCINLWIVQAKLKRTNKCLCKHSTAAVAYTTSEWQKILTWMHFITM